MSKIHITLVFRGYDDPQLITVARKKRHLFTYSPRDEQFMEGSDKEATSFTLFPVSPGGHKWLQRQKNVGDALGFF